MNGKKVDYLPFLWLLSFKTHGIACIYCKTTKRGVSRAKKDGGTGTFSTGFYEELASSVRI
jgi:hypothetical protein